MLHLVKVALNLPGGRLDLHEFAHHHVKEDRDRGFPEFYKIKGKQLYIREIFLIPQGMMVLLLRSSS